MPKFTKHLTVFLSLFLFSFLTYAQIDEAAVEAFIKDFSSRSKLTEDQVRTILSKAEYDGSIIDKMNNPAESKMNWTRYRNIFMKDDRILAGVSFWNEYEEAFKKVSNESGVSEEIILGILGVETFFGQRKGTYKILDALYTLGFGFPKRAKFFKSELEHFLDLTNEEKLDVYNLKGSYAGAMGYCQFMPSSYKAYAKSYDEGGTRDLVDSPEDAIASIANYLKVHKWKEGQMVVAEAVKSSDAQKLNKQSLKPKYAVSYYSNLGYRPVGNISPSSVSTLVQLEQNDGMEYWFGFNNFYVITRYNHSEMYAMAVYQLAEAIDEKRQELNRLR